MQKVSGSSLFSLKKLGAILPGKPRQIAIYANNYSVFNAANTSSSIFFASPNSMRLFSL